MTDGGGLTGSKVPDYARRHAHVEPEAMLSPCSKNRTELREHNIGTESTIPAARNEKPLPGSPFTSTSCIAIRRAPFSCDLGAARNHGFASVMAGISCAERILHARIHYHWTLIMPQRPDSQLVRGHL